MLNNKLAILTEVEKRLAKITSIDEAKAIRDQAEAVRIYAKNIGAGLLVQNNAALVKILAEHKAGEILLDMARNGERVRKDGRVSQHVIPPKTLAQMGVKPMQSHRWQTIAGLDEASLREINAKAMERAEEFTSAAVFREARSRAIQGHVESKANRETCTVKDLQTLIDADKKFGCIYADPPWKYENQATRSSTNRNYKTMTPQEIAGLPIKHLSADNAHLHLWTTNAFLFDCKEIMEAWGFEYKSLFVWVKEQMGIGNYWRVSTEAPKEMYSG